MTIKIINAVITATTDQELNAFVKDASDYLNYKPELTDEQGQPIPNPQSREDFLISNSTKYLVECGNAQRTNVAVESAKNDVVKIEAEAVADVEVVGVVTL